MKNEGKMRGNVGTIVCKDLSIRTKNKSYMESKSEAKYILFEYLEQMMPMMVGRWRRAKNERIKSGGAGWPFGVEGVFYEPFITEKLTKEKLDELNKLDNHIILVIDADRDIDRAIAVNYWIIAPYKMGFVWVNKSNIKNMGKEWGKIRDYERWRLESKELISDYTNKTYDALRNIVYQGLNPKNKTFYLLNPSALAPTITRTLNFSRSGFL